MKILFPLVIVALCVWYYLQTHKEEAPPPPAPVAVAAPKPAPKEVYYHSPLDAPAIPTGTGAHSGTGYTSSSRNTNWRGSHLSDGQTARTSVPDEPADPDGN